MVSRRSLRPLLLTLAVTGLAVAGTAGAFFMRARRDVTTSSEKAWKAYHEAAENDLKMYEREAMSGYAAALAEDPHFVMATLRHLGPIDSALQSKVKKAPPDETRIGVRESRRKSLQAQSMSRTRTPKKIRLDRR